MVPYAISITTTMTVYSHNILYWTRGIYCFVYQKHVEGKFNYLFILHQQYFGSGMQGLSSSEMLMRQNASLNWKTGDITNKSWDIDNEMQGWGRGRAPRDSPINEKNRPFLSPSWGDVAHDMQIALLRNKRVFRINLY